MKNILEYKGYIAKIEFSAEDKVLHGKIEAINDLVTFESESVNEIENEFHQAVDDYLLMCKDLGQEPDKTYSGTFNVRIRPELHKKIALYAIKKGESLNGAVEDILDAHFNNSTERKMEELCKAFASTQNAAKEYSYFYTDIKEKGSYRKGAFVN